MSTKILAQLLGLSEREVDALIAFALMCLAGLKLVIAVATLCVTGYLIRDVLRRVKSVSMLQGVAMPRVRPVLEFILVLAGIIITLQCGILILLALP